MSTPQFSVSLWQHRIEELTGILNRLLNAPLLRFDDKFSALPDKHGIYVIYRTDTAEPIVIRTGRTKTAAEGFRQRIYPSHYMGARKGNIRAQLVRGGVCADMFAAKSWIQGNAAIRFLVIEDDELAQVGGTLHAFSPKTGVLRLSSVRSTYPAARLFCTRVATSLFLKDPTRSNERCGTPWRNCANTTQSPEGVTKHLANCLSRIGLGRGSHRISRVTMMLASKEKCSL